MRVFIRFIPMEDETGDMLSLCGVMDEGGWWGGMRCRYVGEKEKIYIY